MPKKKGGVELTHDITMIGDLNFSKQKYQPYDYSQVKRIQFSNFAGGNPAKSISDFLKRMYLGYRNGVSSVINQANPKKGGGADNLENSFNISKMDMKNISDLTTFKAGYKGTFPQREFSHPYSKFAK